MSENVNKNAILSILDEVKEARDGLPSLQEKINTLVISNSSDTTEIENGVYAYAYDNFNRIIKETVKDDKGQIIKETTFEYYENSSEFKDLIKIQTIKTNSKTIAKTYIYDDITKLIKNIAITTV